MPTIPADTAASPAASRPAPRVRHDLDVFPDEHEGCLLRDRRAGREFKIGRSERLVLHLLDGTRQPRDICRDLADTYGIRCDPGLLDRFIADLHSAGLLDGNDNDARLLRIERRGLLFMVRLLQPDPWVRWITARIRRVNRAAAAAAGGLVVGAAAIVATRAGEIGAQLAGGWTTRTVVAAVALGVLAAIVHEIAHAIVATWHGARLASVGVGMYYFQPCLFCELRGVESLVRWQRLMISGAGLAADVVQASACILVWTLGSSPIFLFTASLLGVRVLLNLNPLVKLDGYYLLVDATGRRDLRESAFGALAQSLQQIAARFQGRRRGAAKPVRRAEVAYGLLAIAYVSAVVVGAVAAAGVWLHASFEDADVIIAVLIVGALASVTDRTLWGSWRSMRFSWR